MGGEGGGGSEVEVIILYFLCSKSCKRFHMPIIFHNTYNLQAIIKCGNLHPGKKIGQESQSP